MIHPTLAVLSQVSDAVDFIFHTREAQTGGVQVGGLHQVLQYMWEHVKLSGAAIAIACAIAIPVGLVLGHVGKGELLAISASNVGRAVPSLALIAFFVAYIGVGFTNVMLALVLLAIPPILTNTYVGIEGVDPDTVEAARGMGLSERQVLVRLELPLAAPLIMAGVRTGAVTVVATATLAGFVGGGGLGVFLYNGFAQQGQEQQLIGGAILVAVLAILTEVGFGRLERLVTPRTASRGKVLSTAPAPSSRAVTAA